MSRDEIYKKIGLDHKELYSSYSSIYKIVWEQVLLISIYARQIYATDQANQFHQRFKLIHESKFLDMDGLQPFILELIEAGCGSTEINLFLLKVKENENVCEEATDDLSIVEKLLIKIKPKLESYRIRSDVNRILSSLENKQIAFPKLTNVPPYSYYSMYQVLRDPLFIFEKMLSLDPSEEALDNTVLLFLNDYLNDKSEFPLRLNFNHSFKFYDTLGAWLKYVEDDKLGIDSTKLNIYIKSKILEKISYSTRDVFSVIQDYNYSRSSQNNNHSTTQFESQEYFTRGQCRFVTPISEISKIDSTDNKLSIIFDQNTLEDLIHLGQVDSIMGGLKEKILNYLNHRQSKEWTSGNLKEANANAFRRLELWHKKLDEKFIKKIDQVPKLIASIIEFDIRYRLGFCSEFGTNILSPVLNYGRISIQEGYILTTNLIKRCLYETSGTTSYKSTLNGMDLEEFISRYYKPDTNEILDLNDQEHFLHGNTMMKIWANEDIDSITDRFKKLPPYLKEKKMIPVSEIINKQRNCKTTNVYPVDSAFPLPLWVKSLKMEF